MELIRFCFIVLLAIAGSVVYGIIHDQITARICVEYFTIGHPPVFGTDDPTLLGLGWGVIATWWVGLLMGIPLAMVSRLGLRPKFTAGRLVTPLILMLGIVGILAIAAGVVGHAAAARGWVWLTEPLSSSVPRNRHVAFITDLWAHLASYIGGFIGGVVLCVWVWVQRGKVGGKHASNVGADWLPSR